MKMKSSLIQSHVLIVHPKPDRCKPLIESLEQRNCTVMIAPDTTAGISQTDLHRFKLVVLSDRLETTPTAELIGRLGANAMTAVTPVIVLTASEPVGADLLKWHGLGAAAVLSESSGPSDIAAAAERILSQRAGRGLDPVSGLISGPVLDQQLERLCSASPDSWYFIEIMLLGIRAYNRQYGYDAGDELIAELAAIVEETTRELGAETDIVGRLHGPRFCIASRTRRIESLCRTLLLKSSRLFRKHYTPFEWMKGYITIEGGKHAGNYHLCEVIAAAVQVPPKWDNNRAFLLDVAEEILEKIPKSKQKYVIITP